MKLEPIIIGKLRNFANDYNYNLPEDQAFERFVNWLILERHQPGICVGSPDMLEEVSVGGSDDMGLDGVAISINDCFVESLIEAKDFVESCRSKIEIQFIFVQSKNKEKLSQMEYSQFLNGVRDFLTEPHQPCNDKLKELIRIKEYLYNDCISKWKNNPKIFIYYVYLGKNETNEYIMGCQNRFVSDLDVDSEFVEFRTVTSKQLLTYCNENENNYTAELNILTSCSFLGENEEITNVDPSSMVAVCRASELLKLLMQDDGLLRRGIFDDNVRDYQGDTTINIEINNTIMDSPEKFVLCNNGITIICKDLKISGKKLCIDKPRIVNGCQTCNVIYNTANSDERAMAALHNVKVILKIVSTQDIDIINNVVRGTNRQNIVQDEAFETIREFHKSLEAFFPAANSQYQLPPLYYERRSRQYDNMGIKASSKIAFSGLIHCFVSIFLAEPHRNVNHPAMLQKAYKNKIFLDTQSLLPYYTAAQIYYHINQEQNEDIIEHFKSAKYQLAYLTTLCIGGAIPNINKAKEIDAYCEKIINVLKNHDQFKKFLTEAIDLLKQTRAEWLNEKGKNFKDAIKDNADFTKKMKDVYERQKGDIGMHNPQSALKYRGRVYSIHIGKSGNRYGFISRPNATRIYFNDDGLNPCFFDLCVGREVWFDIKQTKQGEKAINISFVEQ